MENSGKDEDKNVHYIFIPQSSSAAVSAWAAKPLNFSNASTSYTGYDNEQTIAWYQAKRLTYELQDLDPLRTPITTPRTPAPSSRSPERCANSWPTTGSAEATDCWAR